MKNNRYKLETNTLSALRQLFTEWCHESPEEYYALPHSGSHRRYYRIKSRNSNAIGVYNNDYRENKAFIYMSRFFRDERINVPEIYNEHPAGQLYLTEDLGDTTLFSYIRKQGKTSDNVPLIRGMLREVLGELAKIQVLAGRKLDFSICYPYQKFNRDSILYDLNYFKEQFLDQLGMRYAPSKLQEEFDYLADFIMTADNRYFMYRDFQSRNIMIHSDQLYFIDYQGGRRGPLQYDVASFLYQARASLSEDLREEMLEHYMNIVGMLTPIHRKEFIHFFYPIALLRVLQTLGAYGLRGLKEGKIHFIKSIPLALYNAKLLYKKNTINSNLPEIGKIIRQCNNQMKNIQP